MVRGASTGQGAHRTDGVSADRASDAGESAADELDIIEWGRIRSFLKASGAPLAIIEIESRAHADQVLARLSEMVGAERLHMFRGREGDDFRRPLDWLEEQADDRGVYVFTDLHPYTADEKASDEFWTWANMQRERWPRAPGHVIFLLEPGQVDGLCRYAPMLWDWILLKFNLVRREHAEHRFPASATSFAAAMHAAKRPDAEPVNEVEEELRAAHLEALRDQLLRARQAGIPVHLVAGNYALPLFRALVAAERLDEARRVLESELGYEFPTELPVFQAAKAKTQLKRFLSSLDHKRAKHVEQALKFYLDPAEWPALRRLVSACGSMLFAGIAIECDEISGAETWIRRWIAATSQLGFERGEALGYVALGDLAIHQGDPAAAEPWYRRALRLYEALGDGKAALQILGKLASVELAQKQAVGQDNARTPDRDPAAKPKPSLADRVLTAAFKSPVARYIEKRARKRLLKNC